MNFICETKLCTACSACASICPVKAITMEENSEGFEYPVINQDLCVNCGKCVSVCPENNRPEFNNTPLKVFAAIGKDKYRLRSSSGGAFSVLAEYILSNGGYVCGAAFDDNWNVKHIVISEVSELIRLRGSKYLQSKTEQCFTEIKKLLDLGKTVLFSGTPCQVAGLYNYIGGKDKYAGLITAEVLCHSVSSPKVFRKFLNENVSNETIKDIDFRFKNEDPNLKQLLLKIVTDKNENIMRYNINPYTRMFLNDLINRIACAECKYAQENRIGDFTLGDFWGIEKYNKTLEPYNGISLIITNNSKSESIFNELKNEFKYLEEVPFSIAKQGNKTLTSPLGMHPKRNEFFKNIDKLSIAKNAKACLDNKYDAAILNFWYTCNYGAVLTAYALQELLISNGYSAQIINNCPEKYKNSKWFYRGFDKKYLNLTKHYKNPEDLNELNKYFNTFITGSDQVFRPEYGGHKTYSYKFLDFAGFDKKKIAFAASFGQDYINCTQESFNDIQRMLSSFDYISVRESSGVQICQNYFGIEAKHILDPVFLAEKDIFEKLAADSCKDYSNKIIAYVLDKNNEYSKLYNKLSSGAEIYVINPEKDSIQDFLKAIKQAKFVITDSYHGVCFSLIFNKPFLSIINQNRGTSRFKSLIQTFDIGNYFFQNINQALNISIDEINIDYTKINDKIAELRKFAINELKKALDTPKKFSPEVVLQHLQEIREENKVLQIENKILKEEILKLNKYHKTILLFKGIFTT